MVEGKHFANKKEIDVVGLTDDEKTNVKFTEPSPPEEWYETIELMYGLPKDEINREEIDLTEQQPAPPRGKMNKRKKEEVTSNNKELMV